MPAKKKEASASSVTQETSPPKVVSKTSPSTAAVQKPTATASAPPAPPPPPIMSFREYAAIEPKLQHPGLLAAFQVRHRRLRLTKEQWRTTLLEFSSAPVRRDR